MRKINSLHVIIVKNGETKSSHRAWNEFILLANLSLWQWSSHWTKSIGGNGKASISLTHCALCEKQQLSCFDCQHFPYIFFQISQIGLILNKMQNSQSKSSAFLLECTDWNSTPFAFIITQKSSRHDKRRVSTRPAESIGEPQNVASDRQAQS